MIIRSEHRTVNAGAILLALACILVLLDAVKPLHIDDPFMYRAAAQIAAHPADPYGFDIHWYQWPQPMHEELSPPVVPYWWALGLRLFGERPILWKLWLLPFAMVFVFALHDLLRRFAPRVAVPATAMVVLSPAVLPGLNLMQDIPALALGLAGVACYLRADASDRMGWAMAAGVLVGLAAQTKYTALVSAAAIGVHALLARNLRPGLIVASASAAVFLGWEGLMTLRYGRGMFFGQLGSDLFWLPRSEMAWSLVTVVGGVAPLLVLIGLAARFPRSTTVAGAAVVGGFTLLAWRPIEHHLFLTLGAMSAIAIAIAVARTLVVRNGAEAARQRRTSTFLVLWLLLEIAGYFFAAPFAAVRRVLGVIVVAVLVAARGASQDLASTSGSGAATRRRLVPLLVMNAVLALLFVAVDVREARAQREVIDSAVETARRDGGGSTMWFVGHWGFHYYAPRAGMRRLIPDHTYVRAGDWIVVPSRVDKPEIVLERESADPMGVVSVEDGLPFKTSYGYYGGRWPLERLGRPRLEVALFRVTRDGIPESAWSVSQIAHFARQAGGDTASWTVPALLRGLDEAAAPATRSLAAEVLAELGPRALGAGTALAESLGTDPEAEVRVRAALALGRIGERGEAIDAALERATADREIAVRDAAAEALGRFENSVRD